MTVPSANLAEAVALACPPRTKFRLDPETYAGLVMLDDTPKPTEAAIQAAWDARAIPRPVYTVTMSELRRTLKRDNCVKINAWIGAIQDVETKHAISSWWEYSPTVRSNHSAIPQFQQALNLTDEQADAIFLAAYEADNA